MPLQPPEAPWQDVSMDLIVQLPQSQTYNAVFVVVDRFSKMAHFIPTQTQVNAPDLARLFLDNIVRLHGFPRSIVSDRDPRFLSNFWKELFSLTHTTLRLSTANHPQTDGQTERTNRTLEQYLNIHARHNPSSWSRFLPLAEIAYNNLTHSATGMSPFYLVYQRHANLPLDFAYSDLESKNAAVESFLNSRQTVLDRARQALASARERMIQQCKNKTLPSPFKIHDLVLVHRAAFRKQHHLTDLNKFDDRWFGPYEITRVVNQNAYALALPSQSKQHNVINITFLRLYRTSTRFPRVHPDSLLLPPVGPEANTSDSVKINEDQKQQGDEESDDAASGAEGEFEIDGILDCRLIKHSRGRKAKQTLEQQLEISKKPEDFEFLVKWKGYPIHEATWEPYEHLKHSPEVFNDFIIAKKLPENWKMKENKRRSEKTKKMKKKISKKDKRNESNHISIEENFQNFVKIEQELVQAN